MRQIRSYCLIMPIRTDSPEVGDRADGADLGVVLDLRTEVVTSEPREVTERILDAALVLVGRWGVTKTSLADVAKAAGCSRATVYRAFPGGKTHLFQALGLRELTTYSEAVIEVIDLADDLEDALTRGLVVATRLIHDHEAAQFILEHEPELFLPFIGFTQVEVVYRHTAVAI
jgi:AcrR family transcriptional regulator